MRKALSRVLAAHLLILFPTLALVPTLALGDTAPTLGASNGNCREYYLCEGETGTGICEKNSEDIVLSVGAEVAATVYGTESTATYSCNVRHTPASDSTAVASTTSAAWNSTAITDSNPAVTLDGYVGRVWATCSVNTGTINLIMGFCWDEAAP